MMEIATIMSLPIILIMLCIKIGIPILLIILLIQAIKYFRNKNKEQQEKKRE